MLLELTPDELLATSRSVRRPLDLTRPVERAVLEGCLQLAQQAPMASYARINDVVRHLAEHIHEVPVHVIPCVEGRTDRAPVGRRRRGGGR
jgi:hypothetical protein